MATAQQDPTQTAFDQSAQVPDIPASASEKGFGILKGLTVGSGTKQEPTALEQAIAKHHAQRLDEARMHKKNAATAAGILTYGIDPKTGQPLTDEDRQRYMNEYQAAMGHYEKAAGVNKETKGAIARARQIVEHMIHRGQQKRQAGQGGPPPVPEAPTSTQGIPGTPPYAPGPRGAAPGPGGGGPPQVPFAEQAPFLQARVVDQEGRESKLRDEEAAFRQRDDFIKRSDIDPKSLAAQEFRLTGKIASSAVSRGKLQKGPLMEDENGIPQETYFDPADGSVHSERTGEKVPDEWKRMSTSDLATKTVSLMTPDGPRMYFRKGAKLYDNAGNQIEGDLIPFQRGMLNTTTDREVAIYNPDTHQFEKMIFRSTRKVQGVGTGTAPPPQVPGGKEAKPVGDTGKSGPPPVPGTGAKGGGKRFVPAGALNALNKSATPIREARTALIGDTPGQVGGLAGDLDVFKDPESVKRISNYLALVDKVTETERHAAGGQGPLALLEWMTGLPQELVNLQQGALRDASSELAQHPRDAKFVADYFRALGTIGGMRSATGASAAKWSYEVLRKELPAPGRTNYTDAKRRILNYVHESNEAGVDNPLSSKVDVDSLEKQLGTGKGAARGGKTVHYKVGADDYDIPEDKVPGFLRAFPNAKRQ